MISVFCTVTRAVAHGVGFCVCSGFGLAVSFIYFAKNKPSDLEGRVFLLFYYALCRNHTNLALSKGNKVNPVEPLHTLHNKSF